MKLKIKIEISRKLYSTVESKAFGIDASLSRLSRILGHLLCAKRCLLVKGFAVGS